MSLGHTSSPENTNPLSNVPSSPPPPVHSIVTRARNKIHKPKLLPVGTIKYPLPHALATPVASPKVEPTCYSSTVKHAVGRDAMADEFNTLLKNGTWTLVSPKPTMNIVGSKWVFQIKQKADGSIERYKARLVAKGFH